MRSRDPFDLSGRTALVTGSSRGIGRAIAILLAAHGAEIIVHYGSNHDAAAETLTEIIEGGGTAHMIGQDITEDGAGSRMSEAVDDLGRHVDILVLNAGVHIRRKFLEAAPDEFQAEVRGNLATNLELLRSLVPRMADKGWGRVVTIGSVQQERPNPALLVYAGLKSAMYNIMTNLARTYGAHGVTFNNVAPGMIATDATAPQIANQATISAILDEIPVGIIGQPEDVAAPVLLLCSEAGRFITGVDLLVDGGMHLPGKPVYTAADGTQSS